MSDKDALEELLETLRKMESEGSHTVQTASLIAYLEHEISSPARSRQEEELARKKALAELQIEAFRAESAASLATQAHQHSTALEMFRTTISSGLSARRDMLWINAGAAVAILALSGHFVASGNASEAKVFAPALVAFVMGALLAVVTSGLSYVSQWGYEEDAPSRRYRLGLITHIAAIATWLGAGGLFVTGAFSAAATFSSLGQ